MAKNKISEFSSTPANNTDIANINIAEGCAPSGINNAIRELMAQLKDQQTGADGDNFTVGGNLSVTGTTTLTGTTSAPTPSAGDSSTKIATTAFLASMYPVGSIYTSTVSTNPNALFGFGTWVAFGAGRVMLGNGGGFTAGATGGSADAIVVSHTHTGTTANGGAHQHSLQFKRSSADDGPTSSAAVRTDSGGSVGTMDGNNIALPVSDHTHTFTTDSSGSSGTNANLQPYIVVYMWNRTA
jgi:hypothetical protein